jgi:hypothetical protein
MHIYSRIHLSHAQITVADLGEIINTNTSITGSDNFITKSGDFINMHTPTHLSQAQVAVTKVGILNKKAADLLQELRVRIGN